MSLSDRSAAYVRTLWPMLVGHVAGVVLAWLQPLGLPDEPTLAVLVVEGIALVMSGLVYGAGHELEQLAGKAWWAKLGRGVGRFLLSLGLAEARPPIYDYPPAESSQRAVYDEDGKRIVEMHSITRYPRTPKMLREEANRIEAVRYD